MSIFNFRRLISSATTAACILGASVLGGQQTMAAGLADATSTYMTIQPNSAGTALVYTISWAAPDTDNDGDGVTNGYVGGFGNGAAELDRASNLEGGDLATPAGQDVQYIYNGINTVDRVQWTDPANYTVGDTNPAAISREWNNLGGFGSEEWTSNVQAYGSGEGGVTGVFSTSPDGAGAGTGTGVGIVYDYNSSSSTGLGFLLSGVSAMPNTGYIQVEIPNPTTTWRSPTTGDVDFGAYTYNASHPYLTGNLVGAAGNTDQFITGTYTNDSAVELTVTADSSYSPKVALSGDFDSDQAIGNSDIQVVFGNFGNTGAWYADGDTDADGSVGNTDIQTVFGGFGSSSASSTEAMAIIDAFDPAIADLIYDPSSGNVTLDASEAAGAILTNYVLKNADGTFIPGNWNAVLPGFFDTATAFEISESDGTGAGVAGLLDLGDILPTGMDQAALAAYLTDASYVGQLGSGVGEFELVVIPEPASLALLGLGGLLLIGRRRGSQ